MNLFGIGPTEIFVVLIVILVLFGPDKLPELAKKIGGASREIREGLDSINEQMNTALETSMELEKQQMIKPAPAPDAENAETIAPPEQAVQAAPPIENAPTVETAAISSDTPPAAS